MLDPFIHEDRKVLCLTGGGGKTTTMYYFLKKGSNVIATTTTKIFPPDEFPLVLTENGIGELKPGVVLGKRIEKGKVIGVDPHEVCRLSERFSVVVEADGSRGMPLKLYREGEPVIPECTYLTVVVAGLDALGKRVDQVVFRWEKGKGLFKGKIVDIGTFKRVVLEMRKVVPGRCYLLLNKMDTVGKRVAMDVAEEIKKEGVFEKIFLGCVKKGVIEEI